jgi:amino-acid N-acetyltransferase
MFGLTNCFGVGFFYVMSDYMENKALKMGLEKLFLLTTRTADW